MTLHPDFADYPDADPDAITPDASQGPNDAPFPPRYSYSSRLRTNNCLGDFLAFTIIMYSFFFAQWEHYHTGVLPTAGVTESQYGSMFFMAICGWRPIRLYFGMNTSDFFPHLGEKLTEWGMWLPIGIGTADPIPGLKRGILSGNVLGNTVELIKEFHAESPNFQWFYQTYCDVFPQFGNILQSSCMFFAGSVAVGAVYRTVKQAYNRKNTDIGASLGNPVVTAFPIYLTFICSTCFYYAGSASLIHAAHKHNPEEAVNDVSLATKWALMNSETISLEFDENLEDEEISGVEY